MATRSGRPPDPNTPPALLQAGAEILADGGQLTVRPLSERTGVGKPAIYRRFPNTAARTLAVVADRLVSELAPDTGGLRGDLTAVFRRLRDALADPAVLIRVTVDQDLPGSASVGCPLIHGRVRSQGCYAEVSSAARCLHEQMSSGARGIRGSRAGSAQYLPRTGPYVLTCRGTGDFPAETVARVCWLVAGPPPTRVDTRHRHATATCQGPRTLLMLRCYQAQNRRRGCWLVMSASA